MNATKSDGEWDPNQEQVEFLGPVIPGDKIRVRQTWCPYPGANPKVRTTLICVQGPDWAKTTVEHDTASPGAKWPGLVLVAGLLGIKNPYPSYAGLFTAEVIDG